MTYRLLAHSHKLTATMALTALLAVVCQAKAAVLWDESVSGDLTNNQAAPNAFTLSTGTNAVIGSLRTSASTDNQDWIALTVPAGLQLSALVLKAYTSTDAQGFTGVQSGTNFVGSVNSPASYLGYAHFGTGAQNGSLPATNLVGVDILPIMGDTNLAAGSQGFVPPLLNGTYTFLIQQTGPSQTAYEFDYVVTAVPEPSALLLAGLGVIVVFFVGRTRKDNATPDA